MYTKEIQRFIKNTTRESIYRSPDSTGDGLSAFSNIYKNKVTITPMK